MDGEALGLIEAHAPARGRHRRKSTTHHLVKDAVIKPPFDRTTLVVPLSSPKGSGQPMDDSDPGGLSVRTRGSSGRWAGAGAGKGEDDSDVRGSDARDTASAPQKSRRSSPASW